MKNADNTLSIVTAALLAALTFLATSVFKIPTPTFGYVHIGDGFVLISGFLLGPVTGGLAAGIGSMLSDLLGGYPVWAPGTFVIKFFTAFTGAAIYRLLQHRSSNMIIKTGTVILSGITGEAVMVLGYFLYNILIMTFLNGAAGNVSFSAAATASLAEIPFNIVQGAVGVAIAAVLLPVLAHVPYVKKMNI